MRTTTTILALTASALAAGCAATGERYADHAARRGAVPAQAARVVVYRPADTMQYSGRAASLVLDGTPAAALRLGGFVAIDAVPGEHRLEIDMWDAPGRCALSFAAPPGSTSYFEVAPRVANLVAGTPGALIGTGSPAGMAVGLAVMLSGMAAESAGKACGGAFAVRQVDPAVAGPELAGLSASR